MPARRRALLILTTCAQEGVASNHVFVFAHKPGSTPYTHSAEVKSVLEKTTRNSSKTYVFLQKARGPARGASDRVVHVTLPYGKDTVPLFVVFRAMGFVADKEILQHIVYDFDDAEMMALVRPSIEEAEAITSEAVALDFIGRRIGKPFMTKEKRIQYARDILQKELLPHIGIDEMCETRKAFFLGYMVHRMLLVALGRQPQSDRDSYAMKRLRLAGPLMAELFRCGAWPCACWGQEGGACDERRMWLPSLGRLSAGHRCVRMLRGAGKRCTCQPERSRCRLRRLLFLKMTKETSSYVRKQFESGNDISWREAVKGHTISQGLRYSLATGNWGLQGGLDVKPGVAQVRTGRSRQAGRQCLDCSTTCAM